MCCCLFDNLKVELSLVLILSRKLEDQPTIFEAAVAHQHVDVSQLALGVLGGLILVDLGSDGKSLPCKSKVVVGFVGFDFLFSLGGAGSGFWLFLLAVFVALFVLKE